MDTTKQLEIITDEKDRKMFETIGNFYGKFQTGQTRIQIENFILNDIEYPTEYGKYQQVCVELGARHSQVVDIYYEIKDKELEILLQDEAIISETHPIKKQRLELEKEKMQLRLQSQKARIDILIKEANVFYEYYNLHPEFDNLSDEQVAILEGEQWAHKALNMPLIFEERYGEAFLKKAWGDEIYSKFLDTRKKSYGLLPREIIKDQLTVNTNVLPLNTEVKQIQ